MKMNAPKNRLALAVGLGVALLGVSAPPANSEAMAVSPVAHAENLNQVLEWNQIFIDTLIATNTANSSSQRLGAIVHTAIFDAYNGIERRYAPIFVNNSAPHGASRREIGRAHV